jgi:fucose 4-O-acetylase-like acetyltransferase
MCAACGVMLDHRGVFAPLYLDTALTALPFFFTGHLLRNSFIFRPATHAHMHALVAAFLMIFLMIAPNYIGDSKIIFADNQIIGNVFVAYISAFLGVVSLLLISKAIAWLPLFSYIGRYSMVVLCVHQIFIYALCLHQLGIYENVHLICVVTLILSWLSIPICKRYIPWFVAQKDIIH